MEKILIISSYFPPETGAASNRLYSLAKKMTESGYHVTAISPLPNYPEGKVYKNYKGNFIKKESVDKINCIKLYIYPSNSSNKFKRLFSSLSFSIFLFIYLIFNNTPNKVIIQCSPLITGFFAVMASKMKCKKVILNVSDLWPLAGLEMGILKKGFYFDCLLKIEKFIYKNSTFIIGQSNEILKHVSKKVPKMNKKLFLYRNFPEFEFELIEKKQSNSLKIVYAGLLGIAQGIEKLCKEVKFPKGVEFHIYGDGPKSSEIKAISQKNEHIYYHGSLSRGKLHMELQKYDVTLIALKNRIYGSVPSKIFEYTKLGLPVIYFSNGEGAEIVNNLKLGIAIEEIDYQKLENMISMIKNKKIELPKKTDIISINREYFDLQNQFMDFKYQVLDNQ